MWIVGFVDWIARFAMRLLPILVAPSSWRSSMYSPLTLSPLLTFIFATRWLNLPVIISCYVISTACCIFISSNSLVHIILFVRFDMHNHTFLELSIMLIILSGEKNSTPRYTQDSSSNDTLHHMQILRARHCPGSDRIEHTHRSRFYPCGANTRWNSYDQLVLG